MKTSAACFDDVWGHIPLSFKHHRCHMKRQDYPKVSVITVSCGQTAATCRLMESLGRLTYPNFEVIVVDNGVGPGCQSIFRACPCSDVKVLVSEEKRSYTAAAAMGIRASEGAYALLLSNQITVPAGLLEPLASGVGRRSGPPGRERRRKDGLPLSWLKQRPWAFLNLPGLLELRTTGSTSSYPLFLSTPVPPALRLPPFPAFSSAG